MYSGLILLWIVAIVVFIAIKIGNKDEKVMIAKAYSINKKEEIKIKNKMHKELYKNKDYKKLMKARRLFRIYIKTKNYKDKKKAAKKINDIINQLES